MYQGLVSMSMIVISLRCVRHVRCISVCMYVHACYVAPKRCFPLFLHASQWTLTGVIVASVRDPSGHLSMVSETPRGRITQLTSGSRFGSDMATKTGSGSTSAMEFLQEPGPGITIGSTCPAMLRVSWFPGPEDPEVSPCMHCQGGVL